ncbi:serine/threonine-protein kinase [Streptomyces sp. LP05-1]|uniref:non-specific serine/threonine protein kinase n=1 Tax=Streptomyces pyxinae TaxID=2970734 RepID=A0ABT2CH63_9ACTN|nr:serine/threonine-protein kinase [Streptomyces sp. LP05-1]MCS0636759.1 serine/threonine-protein kinase [Streptomyces sp. LP05-1]
MAETRLIQGRYRLDDVIGRGGMGEVWRATDEALGRRVAVKCLKAPAPQHDREFVRALRERFRREARVAAALQHRGVTVVHDFGDWDGVLYLVMELLDGHDLSRLLERNDHRPLPVGEVVDIADQVADALAHTHTQGVVHRDLKPANIVRLADGTVKICDFGIARLGADIGFTSRLSGSGVAMGTPHYMSPEQIGGEPMDHRSDLYSLGCVLYEIATGAPPFAQEDTWGILVGHRDTAPRPLRELRPGLPVFFERLVLDLLAKDPDDRPADALELRRRIAEAGPVGPERAGPGAGPGPGEPPLPSWTRSMVTGIKAVGTRSPAGPSGPVAGLTGAWTTAAPVPDPRPADEPRGAGGSCAAEGPRGAGGSAAVPPEPDPGAAVPGGGPGAGAVPSGPPGPGERPEDPAALTARFRDAYALGRAGRWAEALEAYGTVAAGRARALGPDHPDTLDAHYETGIALGRLDRPAEALEVYRELAAARARALGPEHAETLRARHGVGVNLGRLARWPEALAEARAVCATRTRALGPEHPDTLVSRREIAVALGWLGRWTPALDHYRYVADTRERLLGPRHPDTLAARDDEAHCLDRLGRSAEAAGIRDRSGTPRRACRTGGR